jgi:hypothetical protein
MPKGIPHTPEDDGIPLRGLGDVRRELARVYRDMRAERIPVLLGNGLTQTLVQLGKVIEQEESSDAMVRLEALEKRRNGTQAESSPNPQAH